MCPIAAPHNPRSTCSRAASRCNSAPFRRRCRIFARAKLRALAVTGAVRNHTLPDVPTIAESGLSGYECSLWQAIVAPAATPPAIVARLNRETTAVLGDPDVRAAFAKHGVEPEPGSPEALAARIRDDVKKWREVITSAGIREN